MSSGLTRGWNPVRVKKTRQNISIKKDRVFHRFHEAVKDSNGRSRPGHLSRSVLTVAHSLRPVRNCYPLLILTLFP